MTTRPPPKLRKDGQPKRSGRPPKDPTQDVRPRQAAPNLQSNAEDDDDLLGIPITADTGPSSLDDDQGEVDDTNVFAGVTRTWLADVFRMDSTTVKKRLSNCPTSGKRRGHPVYDLVLAAQYLVPPRVDVSEYIKAMRPNDLPPILQSAYWDAQKKRQDWEINAGELWKTDDVVEVFSETFKVIKTSVMLWSDNLEQTHGLTDTQRKALTEMSDALMADIYTSLVKQHQRQQTPSQLAQLKDLESDVAIGPGVADG